MSMGSNRVVGAGWIAGALLGLSGCGGGKSTAPEEVGSAVQALSPTTARTYGFESLQDWTPLWSTPTLTLSSTHSEGQSSLALQGGGWMQIQSRALSKEEAAPTVVGFDVRLPPSPVNQWWYGSADLYFDAPSVGVWAQFVGHAELTGLTPGQFHRVELAVPETITTLLNGNYSDLRIRLAINVPSNEAAPYLLDRFTFGQGTPECIPQSDGNPCTDDVCLNGVPAWTPRPVGTACDTNSTVCDGVGTCSVNAACSLGAPPAVDDGNPCTSDACDPANGPVHLPIAAGISCDSDNDVCNGVSRCDGAGACTASAAPSLDDGNPCTVDSCDPTSGVQHSPASQGLSCDDGDPCNGEATCDGNSTCVSGQAPDLNDGNPCTADSCSPSLGVQHLPVANGAACDDATVCNGRETCQSGACTGGASPPIDDGNPCTADACDAVSGALHTALADGTNCESDGDVCNGVSACQAGVCANGSAPVVDDGNPCTADSCQPGTGVVHVAIANGSACDDGNPCTTSDSCQAGACAAGSPKVCVATDQCHEAGTCDPMTGACSSPAKANGVACNDGNACTTADTCSNGACGAGPAVVCAAQDVCHVAGVCDPATGACSQPQQPDGAACDDATVCNGRETCQNGACAAAAPPSLDDGNPCTADACDPSAGAIHTAVADGTSCESDGDVCNGTSTCQAGACQGGTPVPIDDGDPCTTDTCDPATGAAQHTPAAVGTACAALDACHAAGSCDALGQCQAGPPLIFDDGDACTIETCDPVNGLTRRTCAQVDQTVATNLADANAWLYSGANPMQSGVAVGTISRARAALVHGRVLDGAGAPLGGAVVKIRDHAELGETVSQTSGAYQMVVNGGGPLTVQFSSQGFLDAERSVDVAWGDTRLVSEVALVSADPKVSEVDLLDASLPFQVVGGSPSADADGLRTGVALVPAGTIATMKHADGSTEALDFMSVRITEFTVGPLGETRMPAALPPLSAYTYAFEINADEAVAVGATSISFSAPLIYYVDNFLNFPSGTPVPLGSYDREKGAWVPSPNGLVLTIVSVTGGLADVSIDADAAAETPAELAAAGITEAERAKLASLYPAGKSLWRVLLPHFTSPWDCNWGASPPPDATPPPPSPPQPDVPDPCGEANASTIECQNQILRESVPIAGTPFELSYTSQRVPDWAVGRTLDIVVTGPTVPASLRGATLDVEVGGRTFSQTFDATPNRKTTFTWDGLDAQQRGSMGVSTAKVSVGFVYDLQYTFTDAFGYSGNGVAITGDRARGQISLGRDATASLGLWDQRRLGLGAWSLSVHHAYDPESQTIYRGDGTRQAGTFVGLAAYAKMLSTQGPGGGWPQGAGPWRAAVAPDGSVYFVGSNADTGYGAVHKIAPNGAVTIVAGRAFQEGFGGDNGLATNALLNYPEDVELGPDGSIYIADTRNHRVRKVTPDGIIRTIAGSGTAGFSGDGGAATSAQLNRPVGIGLGDDGALYIADRDNYRIRRVASDGQITTVAGRGPPPNSPALEDVPATAVGDWMFPADVAVEADGGLLVADSIRGVVRRVNTKRRVSTVAGVACLGSPCPGSTAEGLPANQTNIGQPQGIVALPDRSFYFADWLGFVRYVDPEGIQRVIAGGGTIGDVANGVAARSLGFFSPRGVAVGPGGIVIPDSFRHRMVTLRPAAYPPLGTTDATIASSDGSEVYQFDAQGRHLTTRDAMTGALRYQFAYDLAGLLTSVTDAYGNVTVVERNAAGVATAVVGPFGQRTQLAYDSNGYLAAIENPLGQAVAMTYTPGGLLTSFQNARGQSSLIQYDSRGRLLSDRDAAGGNKTLTRTELADGWQVALATTEGGTKTFEVRKLADGRQQRKTTFPDSTTAQEARALDGTTTITLTDGTTDTTLRTADPRYGIETPITSRTLRLPSGLTYTESSQRTVTLTNALDPLSIATLVDQRTINGKLWRESYDAPTKTWTITTPMGRRSFRRINDKGDLVEDRTETLLGQILAYDVKGRLGTITQGTRQSLFSYFSSGPANGYLETSRNPLLQTSTFTRDALGRALTQLDPGSNLTNFGWDPDGNLASVTPPGKPAHEMDYTPVNLMSEYSPPALASLPDGRTVYEYNLARQVTRATRPDGLVTDYTYDAAGRLNDIVTPSGTYHRDYYGLIPCAGCAAGRVSRLTSPDSVTLDYQYDGQLLTKSTWSGAVNGAVAFAYNTDFRVKTETVTSASGTAAYQFGFDADTLLTCASPTNCTTPGADAFTQTYHPSHGRPTGSALGNVTEALTYNTVGELATQTGKVGSTTIFAETYDSAAVPRDALGRIKRKVETINGTTGTWDYTYDLAGRLEAVQLDGAPYETYSYDGNGNRLTVVKPGGTTTATYDDQDRLLTFGPWTYSYTPNGELLTKSNSATGANWAYQYDVFGNLKRVDLPSGDVVEYVIDGQNRRVGKKRNGVLVKQWLYEDQLHPVAELDGSGALVARFVFAAKKNSPDLVITGGVTYRVFTDQLGSPRALVNATSGAVAGVMRHDAWGIVLEDSVSALVPFGFAGGIYDAETGLVRFGARDYDASIGRWVSKDPILFESGDAPNLYLYVNGDPANFVDVTGLQAVAIPWWGPLAGGAVAGAAVAGPAGALAGAALACLFLTGDTAREDCDGIYATDIATCNGISRRRGPSAAARCFASAGERFGNCMAGRPLGPLDTWNN